MINHWNEFTIGATAKGQYAKRVSLTWEGIISMNGRVVELLGKPTHAILYFDKANSMIGIMPGKAEQENAIPLRTWSDGPSRIIRAKKFCDFHNISMKCTVIFDEPRIEENGMLVLDLKRTHRSKRLSGPENWEKARRERELAAQPPWLKEMNGQRMFPR